MKCPGLNMPDILVIKTYYVVREYVKNLHVPSTKQTV